MLEWRPDLIWMSQLNFMASSNQQKLLAYLYENLESMDEYI